MDSNKIYELPLRNIYNENESRVCRMIETVMNREEFSKICFCSICIEDIYAIALNSLPARYRHSHTVSLSGAKDREKNIERSVIDAITKVTHHPNH